MFRFVFSPLFRKIDAGEASAGGGRRKEDGETRIGGDREKRSFLGQVRLALDDEKACELSWYNLSLALPQDIGRAYLTTDQIRRYYDRAFSLPA